VEEEHEAAEIEKQAKEGGENVCPTCMQTSVEEGHLCAPNRKDQKCKWCGALIVNQRHLCNKKIHDLSYICSTCGRTAVKAKYLCNPKKIKKPKASKT
jgi:hypothetical protein